MEENNLNNQQRNSSKVIMILLVLIIVGLLGFIVYDKFIQKDTKLVPETNTGQKDCNCPKCEECEKLAESLSLSVLFNRIPLAKEIVLLTHF